MYRDKMTNLNESSIKKQKLSKSQVSKIYLAHDELQALLSSECPLQGKNLITAIEGQEYKLQRLWGFIPDRSFHRYWYRSDKCTCPIMDNDELIGVEMRLYSDSCKLHWG